MRRCGPFTALGFRFMCESRSQEIVSRLERLLAGMLEVGAEPFDGSHHTLRLDPIDARWRIFVDERPVFGTTHEGAAFAQLIWEITQRGIATVREGIVLHAGSIGWRDHDVIISGRSGAGKSTLVAMSVSEGARYLTDEAVELGLDGRVQDGISRPVALDRYARDLSGFSESAPLHEPMTDGAMHIPLPRHRTRGARHSQWIVLLDPLAGPVNVYEPTPAEAVARLVTDSFEPLSRRQLGLETVAAAVSRSEVICLAGGENGDRLRALRSILDDS